MENEKKCNSKGCEKPVDCFYKDEEQELFFCPDHYFEAPVDKNLIHKLIQPLSQQMIQEIRTGMSQHGSWFSNSVKDSLKAHTVLETAIAQLIKRKEEAAGYMEQLTKEYINVQEQLQHLLIKQEMPLYEEHKLFAMLLASDMTGESVVDMAKKCTLGDSISPGTSEAITPPTSQPMIRRHPVPSRPLKPAYTAQGNGPVNSIVIGYDNKCLFYTGHAGINLYTFATGETQSWFQHNGSAIESIAIKPNSFLLATSWSTGNMQLWDLSQDPVKTTEPLASAGIVKCVDISSYDWKVVGMQDGTVHFMTESNQLVQGPNLGSSVASVVFSSQSYLVACASTKGWLMSCDTQNVTINCTYQETFSDLYCLCFAPDGSHVLAGSRNGLVFYWDLRTTLTRYQLTEIWDISSIVCGLEGCYYYVGDTQGNVVKCDLRNLNSCMRIGVHSSTVLSLCMSIDGSIVFSGDYNGEIKGWSIN